MKKGQAEKLLKQVIKSGQKAGRLLLKYQNRLDDLTVSSKGKQGLVSEADHHSEEILKKDLMALLPGSGFLGEEKGKVNFEAPYLWVVDPLDGTHNYLQGFDFYCVCIALLEEKRPILGVVYRPGTQELYYALKGEGAYYGKSSGSRRKKLKQANNTKTLKQSFLATGFATEKGQVFDDEFIRFKKVLEQSRGIRRIGSAALDLCWLAKGQFDGFWESKLAPWDVAAAGLICQEAGVKVTNFEGEPFCPFHKSILAARTPFFNKLKKAINS